MNPKSTYSLAHLRFGGDFRQAQSHFTLERPSRDSVSAQIAFLVQPDVKLRGKGPSFPTTHTGWPIRPCASLCSSV